jgi:hypothetical protein
MISSIRVASRFLHSLDDKGDSPLYLLSVIYSLLLRFKKFSAIYGASFDKGKVDMLLSVLEKHVKDTGIPRVDAMDRAEKMVSNLYLTDIGSGKEKVDFPSDNAFRAWMLLYGLKESWPVLEAKAGVALPDEVEKKMDLLASSLDAAYPKKVIRDEEIFDNVLEVFRKVYIPGQAEEDDSPKSKGGAFPERLKNRIEDVMREWKESRKNLIHLFGVMHVDEKSPWKKAETWKDSASVIKVIRTYNRDKWDLWVEFVETKIQEVLSSLKPKVVVPKKPRSKPATPRVVTPKKV